ncbi:MAG: hypothetical protein WC444_02460 [Candidatus Paceibacterota bacterium]
MKHIIIAALYLLILFCLSTFVFDPSYLYYELPWLDIPMHILGGFGVANLVGSILLYNKKHPSYKKLFMVYLCVAIAWEAYEYIHDMIKVLVWNGWPDTIGDLANGWIGMSIAYLFVRK